MTAGRHPPAARTPSVVPSQSRSSSIATHGPSAELLVIHPPVTGALFLGIAPRSPASRTCLHPWPVSPNAKTLLSGSRKSGTPKHSLDFVQVLAAVLSAPPVECADPRICLDYRVAHRGDPPINRLREGQREIGCDTG
jgi:hypothetical protein